MSYRDDEPKGTIFPGVVLLLAMAGLVGALVSMRQSTAPVRVWVPVQSMSLPAGVDGDPLARLSGLQYGLNLRS
ncbi:hypothetical protein RLEG3_03750 (plasmid) [Rhizobium leguminosarum bv. trifolii WSM1689]|uniref:hypothetical protein n=1 Tax=Rhizobium TaxID=379 RepID=UPI0003E09BBD|nr:MULTISPECIES: hypothetical protein [Rhizobium]AHF88218.1 hypothetical protein RLEG3_03750 [Rhizobium leguminosarum bv. trifolii WSM1689]MBY3215905.1 hypothetical protein [Rhizobium laguerreae]MBY3314472.1 hypothetical protein [Rhizobium laguerreae]MBY5714493.1 hypothetical protein [Rhizobium leguminosarum]